MDKEYINALDAAKKYNLFLKVVTSVKSFDSYNSFFNIYEETEEPCRRIVVLTKNEELEYEFILSTISLRVKITTDKMANIATKRSVNATQNKRNKVL